MIPVKTSERSNGDVRRSMLHAAAALTIIATMTTCASDGPAGPAPPASALRYAAMSAGYYHTCALTFSGTSFCWGGNDGGALGDGTRTPHPLPAPVSGGHRFRAIDAGAGHTCALTESGAAWCWGQNDEGQAGDGTFSPRNAPVAVAEDLSFADISAGHAHSCGLTHDGVAYCWGDDSRGQLGDGAGDAVKSAVPVQVAHGEPFARVVAGYYQTCGLTAAGAAYCWGANESGQGGNGGVEDSHAPVAVAGDLHFTDIAPGDRFVCAVSEGETWCWGANRNGELGPSTAGEASSTPVRLADAPAAAFAVASMGTSTVGSAQPYGCLVQGSGHARCWGGAVRALRPAATGIVPLDDRIRFAMLAAGAQHICGLDREGYAWCGGANYDGQLGDGTQTDRMQMTGVH